MRIIILTSSVRGIASRVLPALCNNKNMEVVGAVLAHGISPNRKKSIRRKVRKLVKIGCLGALNGLRMRDWYADNDTDDIHVLCRSLHVELTETPFINCETTKKAFRQANADLGLSLGNGYIPKSVFSIPKFGMVNLHNEILPDFQGAQSIIWPIHEGRKETGFTIHQVSNQIDKGDILFQRRYPIQFCATLRETVETNLKTARSKIPEAFSYVCENYTSLTTEAISQDDRGSYTTPSIWQFVRMVRNHRKMYKESLPGGSA